MLDKLWSINSWMDKHSSVLSAWASLVAIVGVPLLLFGGYATWLQIKNYLARPDIILHLSTPKDVRFRLLNPSSVLLRDPHYGFSFWDLDARSEGTGEDPGNLKIPSKSMNYIRPRSGIGPWAIKDLSETSRNVPNSHVVFGWAYVQCPDCESRRHYWVLIKKGESAWYCEILPDEQPSIMKNLSSVLKSGTNYPATITWLVPVDRRVGVIENR